MSIRSGGMTTANLQGALEAEHQDGNSPSMLAVSSKVMEKAALRILGPQSGTIDELRSVVPNVELDLGLGLDEWELR